MLCFTGTAKEEIFFVVSPIHIALPHVLVELDPGNVRDLHATSSGAFRVVDVHGKVDHLSCKVKVFGEGNIHFAHILAKESDFFVELDWHIELRVVHDGPHGGEMDTLPVTQLALAPLIVEQVDLHWN